MSTIRASIHGDYEPTIDPETRGAIFDMLAKGYTPTRRVPYVTPVSSAGRPAPYLHVNLRRIRRLADLPTGHIFGKRYESHSFLEAFSMGTSKPTEGNVRAKS